MMAFGTSQKREEGNGLFLSTIRVFSSFFSWNLQGDLVPMA
jgi:hypothetical protein